MSELKKLADKDSIGISAIRPYDGETLEQMDKDYLALSPIDFGKKYRYLAFKPSFIKDGDILEPIQINFCSNPFCKWYGLPQKKYDNIKSKPSRYKFIDADGGIRIKRKRLACNAVNSVDVAGVTFNCSNDAVSNWSVAEEIKRLITINSVIDNDKGYEFHNAYCPNLFTTPFNDKKLFYKRGKSSGNSQKWQCKACKKITNVLPTTRENFSYDQNKNDVLPLFADLLVSRTPVKRACEILNIAPKTYYHKLEWIYRKCLEFLEKNETNALKGKSFDEMWLNTDKMQYYLNNVRQKGKGGVHYSKVEESRFLTQIIASSDLYSRYVFRADVGYDFDITQDEIGIDTWMYHDDHLHSYARKNERLRFPFAPQPPTSNDDETKEEYEINLAEFNRRRDYIQGMHTNIKYTSIAHYWLIKRMFKCKKWRFVSDEDSSLIDSIFRVFADSIKSRESHYFLCKLDRALSLKDAFNLYRDAKKKLNRYIENGGKKEISILEILKEMICDMLHESNLYDFMTVEGIKYPKWARKPIKHPLPSIDEGVRFVDCITDLSDKSPIEIADYLVRINSHSINAFFNQVRRSISILERPLVTARGDGKSYIYANYNPKYAQYAVTILRTFYNFCWAFKTTDKNDLTPAQRLGIADRQYSYKDIIYFS